MQYLKRRVKRLPVKKSLFGPFGWKGLDISPLRPFQKSYSKASPPPIKGRSPAGYAGPKSPAGKLAGGGAMGKIDQKIAETPEGREVSSSLNKPASMPKQPIIPVPKIQGSPGNRASQNQDSGVSTPPPASPASPATPGFSPASQSGESQEPTATPGFPDEGDFDLDLDAELGQGETEGEFDPYQEWTPEDEEDIEGWTPEGEGEWSPENKREETPRDVWQEKIEEKTYDDADEFWRDYEPVLDRPNLEEFATEEEYIDWAIESASNAALEYYIGSDNPPEEEEFLRIRREVEAIAERWAKKRWADYYGPEGEEQ